MIDLNVNPNFSGDILVIMGPVTGTRYQHQRGQNDGKLPVDELDVDQMLTRKLKIWNCGCSHSEKGGNPASELIYEDLFTKET